MLLAGAAAPAAAQRPSGGARWQVGVGAATGALSGWVQVRENRLAGTRLQFRRDLGLTRAWDEELTLARRVGERGRLFLAVRSCTLDASTTLPADVLFNGATIAGGTVLRTRTGFPSFVRATVGGARVLASVGRGTLSGSLALTFVALTFKMQGTVAAGSAGTETKEDFVTQELPVPLLGFRLDYPLARGIRVDASVDGGALPWVNSLRTEGGVVDLTQRHLDAGAGVAFSLSRGLRTVARWRYTSFVQRERSSEDGNDIAFSENALQLGVVARF